VRRFPTGTAGYLWPSFVPGLGGAWLSAAAELNQGEWESGRGSWRGSIPERPPDPQNSPFHHQPRALEIWSLEISIGFLVVVSFHSSVGLETDRSHERHAQLRCALAARLRGRNRFWNDLYGGSLVPSSSLTASGTGVAYANLTRGDIVRNILRWPGKLVERPSKLELTVHRLRASQRKQSADAPLLLA
jgi:hypothetical protein